VLALIVLVLAFGALFAASLPLITALIAIGVGYSLTGLLSHVFSVAGFATILGHTHRPWRRRDYALFIVTRQRNAIRRAIALRTLRSTQSIRPGGQCFFAGITVCIALLGQFALGLSFCTAWPYRLR